MNEALDRLSSASAGTKGIRVIHLRHNRLYLGRAYSHQPTTSPALLHSVVVLVPHKPHSLHSTALLVVARPSFTDLCYADVVRTPATHLGRPALQRRHGAGLLTHEVAGHVAVHMAAASAAAC